MVLNAQNKSKMGQLVSHIECMVYNVKWTRRAAIHQRQVEEAFRRVQDLHIRRELCELWFLLTYAQHTLPNQVAASVSRLRPYQLPELQDITNNWLVPQVIFPEPYNDGPRFFADKLSDEFLASTDLGALPRSVGRVRYPPPCVVERL